MRKIERNNELHIRKANVLVEKFISCVESMLIDYISLFSLDEQKQLISALQQLKEYQKKNFLDEEEQIRELETLFLLEISLKPLVMKCWQREINIISWLKDDCYREKETCISATLGGGDDCHSFCESIVGIEYEITEEAFCGANEEDAAVRVEKKRASIYTVLEEEDYVINSYNMATPLITPAQIYDKWKTYCEIILDAHYAKKIAVVYKGGESGYKIAKPLSEKLGLPLKNIEEQVKYKN